jgi:hypothetical protein
MAEIVNKVKDSGLIQLDMAEFKPSISIMGIDLTEQLWQGLVLREKDFRSWISTHDWSAYDHTAVYIFCSSDAIIPTWAYMLIGSELSKFSVYFLVGSKIDLEKRLIEREIQNLDLSKFKDQRVIVKGCSDIPHPDFASTALVAHIRPVVKSLMYGEPCSTVPIYKKR